MGKDYEAKKGGRGVRRGDGRPPKKNDKFKPRKENVTKSEPNTPQKDKKRRDQDVDTTPRKKLKTESEGEKEELVLLVRNLPFAKAQVKEIDEAIKSKFNGQTKVFIPLKNNGNMKGIAFVTFQDQATALAAKTECSGVDIAGRNVVVEFAGKNTLEEQEAVTGKRVSKKLTNIKKEESDSEQESGKEVKIKAESGDEDVATRATKKDNSTIKTEPTEAKAKVKKEIKSENPRDEAKKKKQEMKRLKNLRLQMNKELEVCVKKRDVKFAEKVFTNFALKSVQPDAYTYTHMINICARYGNVDRAKFFFDDMIAQGVAPNVVTYTSFIKGLVMWGRMDDAVVALKGMKQNKVAPNFRTYSTILRGCLKDGNVDLAVELFNEAKKEKDVQLDVTCYAYVMMCNCYALRTQDAWEIAKSMKSMDVAPSVAKAYASLAVAESVLGKLERAKKALHKAEAALEEMTNKPKEVEEEEDLESEGETVDNIAIKVESESEDENSIAINRKGTIPSLEEQKKMEDELNKKPRKGGKGDMSSYEMFNLAQKEEITAMCTAVKEFLDKGTPLPFSSIKSMEESQKMVILPPKNEVFPVKLRYGSIFKHMTGPGSNRQREIKLEICSGLGDWVIHQAKRSPNVNWISAEIRHERVFQIWSKGVLSGLDNLFTVEADARVLVTKYIPPESLREVFINFPEPPSNENKEQHLLTVDFLKQINGVLQRHGKLIIVTDNFYLAHKLEDDFKSPALSAMYKSTSGVHPYSTQLPPWYGSSYFDKFWTQGQKHSRFFFEYKKTW